MNALTSLPQGPLTMTSREIAELTGKDHGNVMRDIRAMVEAISTDSDLNPCANSTTYTGKDGRQYPQYELDKDTCLTLLLGYDAVARMKVVKRWQELEAKPALSPANLSRLQLIEMAMQAEQERLVLENKVDELSPRAEGFDRIAMSDGSLCLTDAAKTLQVQPRKLTQLLQEKGWVYRRPMGTGWLAYQDRIQSGHLEHKVTTGEKSDGSEWTSTQVRVTARGLTKLADVVRQAGMH
ncbi:Rha family phage regulatory protein [Comamonas odontotermitis]|uniref:Rha family phage regulatory protein n=1 Tax=Comamonas odontotermitis TaxID=379895 RepID=A0ABR6RKC2_9BURK|nr:phage regulatory protein/antirepressor Ant [Comamonas odontotermitis]MBB6579586.1 Rha family phage regulatory protein [Comamonas odontotermitis]